MVPRLCDSFNKRFKSASETMNTVCQLKSCRGQTSVLLCSITLDFKFPEPSVKTAHSSLSTPALQFTVGIFNGIQKSLLKVMEMA